MATRLPVIANPCSADWNQMVGDDRVRFCAQCEKPVYKVSQSEAAALVARGERRCVRMRRPRIWLSAVAAALVLFAGRAYGDASVPKDKQTKQPQRGDKSKEPPKKPAKPDDDFIQGDLLIDR